tara:strand:+ start:430 stop:855 length:426 start_codon:yes stop_codon:yes gene_type:complete
MNDLSKATNVILQGEDPRINFTFMKKEHIVDFHLNPDILYTDKINYDVKIKEGDDTFLDSTIPLNFFDIDSIEDGTAWFKQKYPNLPQEYHEIMAKYQFDAPYTKKQLKNSVKKLHRKGHSKDIDGLKIIRNKDNLFKVHF